MTYEAYCMGELWKYGCIKSAYLSVTGLVTLFIFIVIVALLLVLAVVMTRYFSRQQKKTQRKLTIISMIVLIPIIIFVMHIAILLIVFRPQPMEGPTYLPPQSTHDEAALLSRDECACWNSVENICLPFHACM